MDCDSFILQLDLAHQVLLQSHHVLPSVSPVSHVIEDGSASAPHQWEWHQSKASSVALSTPSRSKVVHLPPPFQLVQPHSQWHCVVLMLPLLQTWPFVANEKGGWSLSPQ